MTGGAEGGGCCSHPCAHPLVSSVLFLDAGGSGIEQQPSGKAPQPGSAAASPDSGAASARLL